MGRLVSISYTPADIGERKPKHAFARAAVAQAELAVRHGIVGDVKGAKGKRQLNVMRTEDLDKLSEFGFCTAPGELGEQLVVTGVPDEQFQPGCRLSIGSAAVIEVAMEREPCDRFQQVQGLPIEPAVGLIGVLAKVVVAGAIRVGDEVELASVEL